jgi:hypothetical protein
MKFRFKHVQAGILIFIFIMSLGCQKQKTGWQGTIEEENGIRVVKNPAKPMYGELVLELEEDLSIGSVEDENTLFYRLGEIVVDSQNNIYVMDSGNHRIQKFDKDGNYLQTIGRKGEGPGEFMRPFRIFLDEQGNIYVSEIRKLNLFDSKGNYIKSFVLPTFIMGFTAGPEGNIIGHGFISSEKAQNFGVMILDSEGKIIKNIAEFPGMRTVSRGNSAFSFTHSYRPQLSFSPVEKKGAVYGYGSEYKLIVTDYSGETSLIIEKNEPPQSITRREKDKIIDDTLERTADDEHGRWPRDVVEEGADFPDHRPFFEGIATDDTGRIYVRKVKSVLDESEEDEMDIFSADGYYLYTTKLNLSRGFIKGGFLYDTSYSEETGEYKVLRYRIKNWDRIKVSK